MAMTAAERKRRQRQRGSIESATVTVTMSRIAKTRIQRMTNEYDCTISELVDALSRIPYMGSVIAHRLERGQEASEYALMPWDIDPLFMALNEIYESNATANRKTKLKTEPKPKPLLKAYKKDDL